MAATLHAPPLDRVRANTWSNVNHRLDREAQLRLREAAGLSSTAGLTRRIDALEEEWDIERVIELEASVMGLFGLGLSAALSRRFLVQPAFVALALLVHATHGWYPLLPFFRRLGARSRDEVEAERFALKALRGDFAEMPPVGTEAADRAAAAWKAVCA